MNETVRIKNATSSFNLMKNAILQFFRFLFEVLENFNEHLSLAELVFGAV